MFTRTTKVLSAAGAGLLLTAAGVGAAQYDKAVTLSVDGSQSQEHVFGSTVGDLLDDQGIALAKGDLVSPGADAPLRDGDVVSVEYARPVTITVDGKTRQVKTTETTVDGVLAALGLRSADARLSVSRSQSIGRAGLALTVTTPRDITVTADGKTKKHTVAAATVSEALDRLGVTVGKQDQVSPKANAALKDGMKIAVKRVTTKTSTSTQSVAYRTVQKRSGALYTGATKVEKRGVNGVRTVKARQTLVDGKLASTKQVSASVTKTPVNRVVLVGTKQRPAATTSSKPSTSSRSTSPSRSTASRGSTSKGGTNAGRSGMWDRVAACESGGNWSINTGNGYYGGLQFASGTWLAYGGGQFASRADLASRAQQITVANRAYADNGLSQWGCKG